MEWKPHLSGTPDVVKFKQTRDFFTLKEAVAVQEALPFVQSDLLDELAWKRVARFLNILGLLAKSHIGPAQPRQERVHIRVEKLMRYRFELSHHFSAVSHQFNPLIQSTAGDGVASSRKRYCMVDSPKEYRFRYHHKSLRFGSSFLQSGWWSSLRLRPYGTRPEVANE